MVSLDQQTPEQHRQRYFELKAQARAKVRASPAAAPPALDAGRVIHREIIPGGWYWTTRLDRGQTLRIVNTHGTPGVSALFWNADDPAERYNQGDTVKLQWTALLTAGRVLFSDMGRVLVSITADTCGHHDALAGGSTPGSNQRQYGDAALRSTLRSTGDNFRLAAGKHGLSRRDVPPCITFFAGLRTDERGRLHWQDDATKPGDLVDLRAEMNVLAALSNCPHPLSPGGTFDPAPVEAVVWQAPPAAADDPCRHFGEEAGRGFENTDALFRGALFRAARG
jgi:urea carboxylase-associated protein 2